MKIAEAHTIDAIKKERIKNETRSCTQCDFEIAQPFVERCPRCFAVLPRLQLDCTGCVFLLGKSGSTIHCQIHSTDKD